MLTARLMPPAGGGGTMKSSNSPLTCWSSKSVIVMLEVTLDCGRWGGCRFFPKPFFNPLGSRGESLEDIVRLGDLSLPAEAAASAVSASRSLGGEVERFRIDNIVGSLPNCLPLFIFRLFLPCSGIWSVDKRREERLSSTLVSTECKDDQLQLAACCCPI